MAVREIIKFGNPILNKKSKKVLQIDDEVLKLIDDLKDTLNATSDGVGIAAPQVGVLKKIIYIDLRDESDPIVLINPRIIKKVGREESIEGCLSYPGYEGKIMRPKKIIATAINLKGEEIEYNAEGFLAKVFCHEIDHLEGIIYIDRTNKVYKLED